MNEEPTNEELRELARERVTELEKSINLEDVKRHVKEQFNKALDEVNTISDLVFLLYRDPVCQHPCGISYTLTNAIPIDEDDYRNIRTANYKIVCE